MFHENAIQFKYRNVVGYAYHNEGNKKAIIFCQGGPTIGDNGQNKLFSEVSGKLGVSVLVPDYIGSGRSSGEMYTIESCCETISQLEELLLNNNEYLDCWESTNQKFNINEVLLIGHSWGGTTASLHFKFHPNTKIKNVVLIAGALDYDINGHKKYGGESDAEFWQQVLNGWTNYYRNIDKSNWRELALSLDKQNNPLDNVTYLADRNVYLVHGKQDQIVMPIRTENYLNKLKEILGDKVNVTHRVFEGDHFGVLNLATFEYLISNSLIQ